MNKEFHKILEKNILDSFRLVKNDIIKIHNVMNLLSKNQERIMEWINDTRDKELVLHRKIRELEQKTEELTKLRDSFLTNTLRKVVKPQKNQTKKKKENKKATPKSQVKIIRRFKPKIYVASKYGKTFHTLNCPFAKNIKLKSKIRFKSKVKALNEGFKACECVKKID